MEIQCNKPHPIAIGNGPTVRHPILMWFFTLLLLLGWPLYTLGNGFKFKIKNNSKMNAAIFYKISKKSGSVKIKALMNLNPNEEKLKSST